jgi:RNA chaperone Hfq
VNQKITEDAWLDAHIEGAVNLYLCSGTKLQGLLLSHDLDVIVLGDGSEDPGQDSQLIYKSAISTIQPIRMRKAIRSDLTIFPARTPLRPVET